MLFRSVADIALMPERNILQARLGVTSQQPCQPGHLLAGDRVPLVRHGRRPLLALDEWFLDFTYLSPLQVADLGRELIQGGPDQSKRQQKFGVPIPGNNLARDRCRREPEPSTDVLFHERRQMSEGPDGAREFTIGNSFLGPPEAVEIAPRFAIPKREFQTKGHRLGMNAVRPTDHDRLLMATGELSENQAEGLHVFYENARSLLKLNGEGGVYYIIGGQPKVEIARLRANPLRHRRDKSDDVVADFPFDLLNAVKIIAGALRSEERRVGKECRL